ncbi:MAG: YHS domain-containing protein [bacterium]
MKTKTLITVLILFLGLVFISQSLLAQQEECCEKEHHETEKSDCQDCQHKEDVKTAEENQENCPVMGNKINKEIYTDYQGKRVYFCCSGCVETFKKDPEKYMKKMKDAGVKLESVPCPVSGKPSNPEDFTEYKGEKVYFCCEGCKEKFEKNPDKYIKQDKE